MPNLSSANADADALHGPMVVVLAYDRLCTFEFGIAFEIFGLPRPEMGPGWYRYRVAAIEPGRLRGDGFLEIAPPDGLEILAKADLVVIPGWRGARERVPPLLIEALQEAHGRGARIATLCSGVFVAAAAGLLDGRRATTHWRYLPVLADAYPLIAIEPDVLYVDDGSVLTAAGSAAGIDLCLHLVRKDFGAEAANMVARRLVVPPHRDGGQAQFIERPVPTLREGARLGQLVDWMRDHLAEPQPIAMLARRAGMSLRTFQRRFEETTGLTPGAWLIQERINRAQELLETASAASLDDIADWAGFQSQATFRHHFRAKLGTTPSQYRQQFGRRI